MRVSPLVREVERWIVEQGLGGKVQRISTADAELVLFEARTTKTRASSMVTRLELMVGNIVGCRNFRVGRDLVSDPPKDRSDLATWTVYVVVERKKKQAA